MYNLSGIYIKHAAKSLITYMEAFIRSMQYFLKARFHFNKNQYADLLLIFGVAGTISQVCFT